MYTIIAEILSEEDNLEFASLMVVSLNMILFTTKELLELRLELQSLATSVRTNILLSVYKLHICSFRNRGGCFHHSTIVGATMQWLQLHCVCCHRIMNTLLSLLNICILFNTDIYTLYS